MQVNRPTKEHSPLIAVTGSIGSGKSAFAKQLSTLGAAVIDADIIAREVVTPGSQGLTAIRDNFGAEMIRADGTLDRRKLASVIFADSAERAKLESILHPLIRSRFLECLKTEQKKHPPLIVYVVPLLFETANRYDEMDAIVLVAAPHELCLSRICARDSLSPTEAAQRLAAQMPIEEKRAKSDYVVENDRSIEHLAEEAKAVFELYSR